MKLNKHHIFPLILIFFGVIMTILFATGLRKNNQLIQEVEDKYSETTTSSSSKSSTTEESVTTASSISSETTSTASSIAETTTTSSSTETTAAISQATTSETSPVVLDVNDFISKYNNSELDTSLTYQFDAVPIWQEDWDTAIYIEDGTVAGFMMFANSSIANKIKDSTLVTFTVRIDANSTIYIDPVHVISAKVNQ